MNPFKTRLTWYILVAVAFASCNNEDDPAPQPTVLEIITSGTWYGESQSSFPMDDCDKRSSLRLLENGNFILESFGDSSGTCEMAGSNAGTWELNADTELVLAMGEDTETYTLISVTEDLLVMTYSPEAGETITATFDKTPGDG